MILFFLFLCSFRTVWGGVSLLKLAESDKFWWVDREIMHAMWKPQKFKAIYLLATLYVLTLTLPSASAVYWAFGDMLLNHSNAFALLPRSPFRDIAVILMLIHQACPPSSSSYAYSYVLYINLQLYLNKFIFF